MVTIQSDNLPVGIVAALECGLADAIHFYYSDGLFTVAIPVSRATEHGGLLYERDNGDAHEVCIAYLARK